MIIAIYGSRRQDAHLPALEAFLRSLDSAGHEVVMHPKLYNYLLPLIPGALRCVRRVLPSAAEAGAQLCVSIGGDGTFLRTAQWIGAAATPIAGVNTGHLGYLTAMGIEGLHGLVPAFEAGLMRSHARSLIEVTAPELPFSPYALNEVSLQKSETAAMINVEATLDGTLLADYRVDGLLVSTPTGSTAYNLSVGGPIVQPSAPVWTVSPIAAHSLSMRPIVINDSARLTLRATGRTPHVRLSIDGRGIQLDTPATVELRRAPFELHMLQGPDYGFASTLRHKLHWGED